MLVTSLLIHLSHSIYDIAQCMDVTKRVEYVRHHSRTYMLKAKEYWSAVRNVKICNLWFFFLSFFPEHHQMIKIKRQRGAAAGF